MKEINRIKAVLADKKVSNNELAEFLDIRKETVSRWCNNRQQPSLVDLDKIAEFLNVDIRELLHASEWGKK